MDTNLIQLDTEEANVPTYADNDDDLIFEVSIRLRIRLKLGMDRIPFDHIYGRKLSKLIYVYIYIIYIESIYI